MAAEWKNSTDADVILRASGGKELHAHKLVLSLASPVFRDMFSVPQPPAKPSQTLTDIVEVDDSPETLGIFLQIIYPIPNPPISDVETFASLLRLTDKYDAKVAPDIHTTTFPRCAVITPSKLTRSSAPSAMRSRLRLSLAVLPSCHWHAQTRAPSSIS